MKKPLVQTVILVLVCFLLQSCYDNPTFLEENVQEGDGYYPVLSQLSGYKSQYNERSTVTFLMEYFSQSKIDAITLDEVIATPDGDTTRSQVFSKGSDAGTFVDSLDLNTLNVSYTVPPVPDSTWITLKSKITNKNTLADSLSFTFIVLNN